MSEDRQRLELTAIGGLAGAAGWWIHQLIDTGVLADRPAMVAVLAVGGVFWGVMASTGPLPLKKALPVAVGITLPATLLALWASFRFHDIGDFLETGHPWVAVFILLTLPLPFAIAELSGRGWRSYPALFDEAWALFARAFAAILFAGFFWVMLWLSSELLDLVHLGFFDDVVDSPFLILFLSGAVGGLGLAVAGEHSFDVLPRLGVRLVRLLLPLLVVIVAIFLAALVLQGLQGVFGGFSAAATLLAVTFAAATFVTATLDREDAEATRSRILKISAQAMSVLMVGLAGLAAYSLWLRISDHGWTPDRLAAATLELAALAYAFGYLGAVVSGRGWMERIRQANLMIALGMIAVSALWLTPVINPQRISVANQLARFEAGKVGVDDLDLWTLTRGWGRAGADMQKRLIEIAAAEDRPALQERLDRVKDARSRYDVRRQDTELAASNARAELEGQLRVLPSGRAITTAELATISDWSMADLAKACDRTTPGGNPACIALEADFWPDRTGEELMIVYAPSNGNYVQSYVTPRSGGEMSWAQVSGGQNRIEIIDRLVSGDYEVAPPRRNVLYTGDARVEPQ